MKKSATVEKAIPVSYDLGNLALSDANPLDLSSVKGAEREERLAEVSRDNVQLLVNQILQLPIKRTVDSVNSGGSQNSSMALFVLPEPLWRLPREKPVPKDKPKTRWELFAEKKGIKKRAKDGKMVFDEQSQQWVPKWGYGGINKKADNQWLVEYDDKPKKPAGDELMDPRSLSRAERKDLVKKSYHRQRKNARANNA